MQSTAARLLSRSLRVRRCATKNIFHTTYGSPCRRHLASSLQSSLNRTTHTADNSRSSTTSRSSSAISSALDTEEEIERFTAECMQELLPHYAESLKQQQTSLEALSALDLELGDYAESENKEEKEDDWIIQEEAAEVIEETPKRNLSAFELLSNFDPQNPPSTDNLHDLELWLECQAQQEAVARYQSVIDAARQRKDYSSLSMVQKEVLHWFQPLTKALEQRQKEYMLKEQRQQHYTDGNNNDNNDNDDGISGSTSTVTSNNNTGIDTQRAAKKYGPFLCTLPPEKLAVITAHAAIIHALTNGTSDGIPFVNMAKRLGEAVEEEVVIQRVLYKRFRDNQERNKWNRMNQQTVDEEENTTEMMSAVPHSGDDQNDNSNDDIETEVSDQAIEACLDASALDSSTQGSPKWAYSPSHLQSFLDEIKETKPKKRRVVSYAVWKARQILEKEEEWTVRERIQLGAALFQGLLENAKIRGPGNEPAFTYEKRWTKKDKLQSFVVMNERLQQMIVSDKLQSFGATTTRNKPMIVPPTPWTAPNKGGYKWLKVDLLRFHGCNTQRVS